MRKGISITVTPADRVRLQSIMRDRNSPQKHVWRARIIVLTADGNGTTAITRAVGKGKTVVWRWQERFMHEAVEGLTRDKTRPSRIPPLPAETVDRVIALTNQAPPAQREACEAFINSQRHEGWVCLRAAYDDGGFSGGTMERPALQRLLADITAGRVDTVVVYKIDRLTRSLADFAKIVEILDQRSASFVSVTQQFNTTTWMGRLTLNVLLSFAQFEREVIGERIRDKIAASKRKGMWMGGVPPLGYRVEDRKLVIIDSEAEIVRAIFRRYAELGSVRLVKKELDARGIKSKSWTSASGRPIGGKPFSRGALCLMLQNRTYLGEIVHKGQSHPGDHATIIGQPLWDAAQSQLGDNTAERSSGTRSRQPSLLAGILFDPDGNRMTPTHAVKKGTRYRYYVSRPLITSDRSERSPGLRIPAAEIEQLVTSRVRQWLVDPASIYQATRFSDALAQRRLLEQAAEIGKIWPELPGARQRALVTALIGRIDVGADQ